VELLFTGARQPTEKAAVVVVVTMRRRRSATKTCGARPHKMIIEKRRWSASSLLLRTGKQAHQTNKKDIGSRNFYRGAVTMSTRAAPCSPSLLTAHTPADVSRQLSHV
jgi:hypothetical protein